MKRIPLPQGAPLRRSIVAGKTTAQYTVIDVLGQAGGFAFTYKCHDNRYGRTVAIKEFYPEAIQLQRTGDLVIRACGADASSFEDEKNRFYGEALNLKGIEHPQIVKIFDLFSDYGTSYIVMEFISGKSLAEYVAERQQIPWAEALDMMFPILDAFAAIHDAGMIYQDGSPANLLVRDTDRSLVLIDFGAVRCFGNSGIPVTGIGTPGFRAPEPNAQGPWSDIHTLAALLYYMITGNYDALQARGPALLIEARRNAGEPDLLPRIDRFASAPKWLVSAIHDGLSADPAKRPQSIDAFRKSLTPSGRAFPMGTAKAGGNKPAFNSNTPYVVSPSSASVLPPARKLLSLLIWGLSGVAFVALLIVLGYWLYEVVTP